MIKLLISCAIRMARKGQPGLLVLCPDIQVNRERQRVRVISPNVVL